MITEGEGDGGTELIILKHSKLHTGKFVRAQLYAFGFPQFAHFSRGGGYAFFCKIKC